MVFLSLTNNCLQGFFFVERTFSPGSIVPSGVMCKMGLMFNIEPKNPPVFW